MEAHWDGMRCMNSFFTHAPNAQCHLVDFDSVVPGQDSDGGELTMNAGRILSDGRESKFWRSYQNNYASGAAYTCTDGKSDEGKCTFKICAYALSITGMPGPFTVSWKDSGGNTITRTGNNNIGFLDWDTGAPSTLDAPPPLVGDAFITEIWPS